ncbi:hypothetical protein ASPWEDRAFT_736476 [Aspergillus wentii DTO 134E9]|uniref:Uncharacterized protein n=1 Tax=Aspergillus wentii DTO 134E9 TaxID=1073089 RepID=A0A1L9RXP1_ASPWE|nr:uncharacterized protein ASPWEDRAFT_736476 [Aspergillus wentii DTO 134E9]OJJ39617.1 hypothetical protein ASPWEDRAFT_736476 [Aspergillus wentii DTO 134E9]
MIKISNEAEEDRITVSELVMLVSWMLGGMRAQTYALWKVVPWSKFHIIFPVNMISFIMPTHARVIQGYFDDKLRIQFSGLYNFNILILLSWICFSNGVTLFLRGILAHSPLALQVEVILKDSELGLIE